MSDPVRLTSAQLDELAAWGIEHLDLAVLAARELRSSRLTWTTERPKVPGWYWYSEWDGQSFPWLVFAVGFDSGGILYAYAMDGSRRPIETFNEPQDRWAGPLPEPTEPEEPT